MHENISGTTRREFMQMASAAVFIGGRMRRHPRDSSVRFDRYPRAGDPQLQELATRALDAAKAAGATYTDVRFTLTEQEDIGFSQGGWLGHRLRNLGSVGVRVLINGAWGFVSSTTWTLEELTRLGHAAAVQGMQNGHGRRQPIEWISRPAVSGTWIAPVQIDPFTVPLTEKIDVGLAFGERIGRFARQYVWTRTDGGCFWRFRRQETTFVSSEGSLLTQTRYCLHPSAFVRWGKVPNSRQIDRLQPCAGGWEVLTDPTLYDEIEPRLEESVLKNEQEACDPGRYDIVCDATVVAQLLAQTVGVATELDRVLGYEANAGGTSYLAPPEDILGQFALGPASLNVMATRAIPGLLGTTKWDDEGVTPDEYPVIKDGVVVGYHTNRELTPVLAAWDAKQGRAARSHGCAVAASGQDLPLVQPPNLVMAPAATNTTFNELVSGLEHGIVFVGGYSPKNFEAELTRIDGTGQPMNTADVSRHYYGNVTMDRQQLNGELHADFVYEVRHGKRVRTLGNVEALFRAPDLWKQLQAIGGTSTQMDAGYIARKGEPEQETAFGVRACAARFKQVAITDSLRKA